MAISVQSRQTNFWGIVVFSFLTVLLIPHITYAADDLYVSSCSPSCSTSNTVVSGAANGTVHVYIIADFPQAEQGVDFSITYDPTVLTYSGVSNGSAVSAWATPYSVQVSSSGNTAIEDFQLGASSPSGAVAPGSGTLQVAVITFTVNGTPSSSSSVLNLGNASFVNVDYTSPATPTLTNGSFVLEYPLICNNSGTGSISYGNSNCSSPTSCPSYVNAGNSIVLYACPGTGYAFTDWDESSTNCGGSTGSCSITVSGAITELADFAQVTEPLTVNHTNGSVTCNSGTCTSPVNEGSTISFAATPNTNYSFSSWSVTGGTVVTGCTTTASSCQVTIGSSAVTVTATFAQVTEPLTVTATNGSVTCNSGTCTSPVNEGSTISFAATPNTNYSFSSWSVTGGTVVTGCTTTASSCQVTVGSSAVTVTATFAQVTEPLTVNHTNGSVTCNSGTCTSPVNEGSTISFAATPNTNYSFSSWTVTGGTVVTGCTTTASSCQVTIGSSAVTVTATFAQVTEPLTITATNGSVTCNSGTCTSPVNEGATISFAATPNTNYSFSSWTVTGGTVVTGCTTTASSCQVTIGSSAVTVTATFAQVTEPLTITATNGSVTCNSGTCTSPVNEGSTISFAATPNTNYSFSSWSVTGGTVVTGCTTTASSCQVTVGSSAVTVTATFAQVTEPLTVNHTNGSVTCNSGTCTSPVNEGSTISFAATPNTAYTFNSWTVSGATVVTGCTTTASTCQVTVGSTAVTVTATFGLLGDVLGQGSVTPGDALAVRQAWAQFSVGGQAAITVPNFNMANALVNGAGTFQYGDVMEICQYQAGVPGITL